MKAERAGRDAVMALRIAAEKLNIAREQSRSNGRTDMRRLLLIALIAGWTAAQLPAQLLQLRITGLDGLAAKAKESVDITLDSTCCRWPADSWRAPAKTVKTQPSIKHLLAGLKAITVRSFEFNEPGQYRMEDLEPIRAQLRTPGWSKIISAQSKDEISEIYTRIEQGKSRRIRDHRSGAEGADGGGDRGNYRSQRICRSWEASGFPSIPVPDQTRKENKNEDASDCDVLPGAVFGAPRRSTSIWTRWPPRPRRRPRSRSKGRCCNSSPDGARPRLKTSSGRLRSVVIRHYEFAELGQYADSDLDTIRSVTSRGPDWSRIINVNEEKQRVEIYMLSQDGKLTGFLLIVARAEGIDGRAGRRFHRPGQPAGTGQIDHPLRPEISGRAVIDRQFPLSR